MTSTREPQTSEIPVTKTARAAISQLKADNGDILFHLPGGCCDARTPVCLPEADLHIGPRDRLVGHAEGVPVYEMTDGKPACARSYRLDGVEGLPVGFSLSPGDGKCFTLREIGG